MVRKLLLVMLSSIILSACTNPTLPDPRAAYPKPPAELVKPARTMEPIK